MILTLAKLKVSRSMSRETLAFTADVCIDGKCIASARNDGGGGCASYYPSSRAVHETIAAFEQELKTLPPKLFEGYDVQARNLSDAIDRLACDMDVASDVRKRLTRYMKTSTVFVTSDGKVTTHGTKGPEIEAKILAANPGAKIVNGMTIDDAVTFCTPYL